MKTLKSVLDKFHITPDLVNSRDTDEYFNQNEEEITLLLLEVYKKFKTNNFTPSLENIWVVLNLDIEEISYNYNQKKDEVFLVLHDKISDTYVMAVGYYSSYQGDDFNGTEWVEVKKYEKTVEIFK
jgi:hypothetical protein